MDRARNLQRLVPREFAERLLATRGQIGRERRTVTILFSDVKGCMALAESLDPKDWHEIMDGTFDGDSTEVGHVVIYRTGSWSFRGTVSFSQVTVDGKSGTLEMFVVGSKPDMFADWQGRWVILSGTGDLARLRGQGTWWGPGAPDVGEWGDIYYEGQIHFEP